MFVELGKLSKETFPRRKERSALSDVVDMQSEMRTEKWLSFW